VGVFSRDSTRAQAARYDSPRAITASATRLKLKDSQDIEKFRKRRATESWQTLGWEYYDAIGEIKYAFNLMSAVTSRVRLYVGVANDLGDVPDKAYFDQKGDDPDQPDDVKAAIVDGIAAMNRLYANNSMSNIMHDFSMNLLVAGECYLVQEPALLGDKTPEKWSVMSVDQLKVDAAGKIKLKKSLSQTTSQFTELDPDRSFIGRVWRQHPRYSDDADSSMRGILELCDELLILNRAARAIERSRLNAGAMYLPDGLSVSATPDVTSDLDPDDPTLREVDDDSDSFEEQLMLAMTTPIQDEDAASAVVPLIIRGPADLADKIKLFKFERGFDKEMVDRAERVIDRILVGLDVPKDAITGLAHVKYANAVQITESLYRAHVEPLCVLICDSITQVYLSQSLLAAGHAPDVVRRIVVWYDPSNVVVRPDKGASADAGYDRLALSAQSWREAHGFTEDDAPTEHELMIRIALERGVFGPDITNAVFRRIDPTLMADVRAANQQDSVAPVPSDVQNLLDGAPPAPGAPTAPGAPKAPGQTTPPAPAAPKAGSKPDAGGRPANPAQTRDPRAPQTERDSAAVS
jgi:hypothetical protein